jgi:predicted enzyme related to lactoylglutathione lyase
MRKPHVVQFEITGKDSAALHRFYASLFGWELQEARPGSSYKRTSASETGVPGAIGTTRSGPNGGQEAAWDGGPGQVTVYVEVPDVRESVSTAERLGGKLIAAPYDVAGRQLTVAFIADPEGHVVGLSQGLQGAMERLGYTRSS